MLANSRQMRVCVTEFLLFLALLSGLSVLASKPAWAACVGLEPEALSDNADLIAIGIVEGVAVQPMSSTVEIAVEQVYKGTTSGETLVVTTTSGSQMVSSDDVQFEEGGRYLLYLMREGDSYTTSICSGSQPVGGSLPPELADTLGEGMAPAGTSRAMPQTGGPDVLPFAALTGLAVLGVGAVLVLRAR